MGIFDDDGILFHDLDLTETPPGIHPDMIPVGNCIVCHQPLVLLYGEVLDNSWDELVCFPHEDMGMRHVSKSLLEKYASDAGAQYPTGVVRAYMVLSNFWHHAPDNKPEREAIEAAKRMLTYTPRPGS